jgi:microcystin-dependent protein
MKKFFLIVCLALMAFSANAQDPYLGEIRMVGFNFVPEGWAACNGQQMSIAQNSALYALLGSTYGGDDRTYFNLPDLRGRLPINPSQGIPGVSDIRQGQKGGSATAVISQANLPYVATGTLSVAQSTTGVGVKTPLFGQGASQPLSTQPPYLGVYFIIATQGIFPPRQ